jgi:magnesium chelatase subunit H
MSQYQPLGNDRASWSDEMLGNVPNIYVYAANNPSESILAKRRGYATLVSYNVPPYGRAGLYMELANLKELVEEYRSIEGSGGELEMADAILSSAQRCGMLNDVPVVDENGEVLDPDDMELSEIPHGTISQWVGNLTSYLAELQNRLFSSGLHVFGNAPTEDEIESYLKAYYGDKISDNDVAKALELYRKRRDKTDVDDPARDWFSSIIQWFQGSVGSSAADDSSDDVIVSAAADIAQLLHRSTEELDAVLTALDGGYVLPNPGGDLIRDGTSVLPTGRNIHALDPYRMPSAGAWIRGQKAAEETLRQHRVANEGRYPETVAVTLWGLDAIKTRGESVAIVLALVGARPVKEGTGRVVRFDLVPIEELGRPRVDVLASLSGVSCDCDYCRIVDSVYFTDALHCRPTLSFSHSD